jgi:transmembrane sensor
MLHEQIEYNVLISKYLDNGISSEEKKQLEFWIMQSKENKAYFWEMAKSWEESTIALQDKTIVRKQLIEFFERQKLRKRRTLLKWISGAAAVILLLISLQLFLPNVFFGGEILTVSSEDTKKEVFLPDGSQVWLNAHSMLSYSSKFNHSRKVRLTGEALFDVHADQGRNFVVETDNVTIEVLGTLFLVSDRGESSKTETVLESGKINLKLNKSGEELQMKPNQQVVYNHIDGSTIVKNVNAADYTSWRKSSLIFENTRLRDVFIQMERWYNVDIQCNNSDLLNTPVSFTIDEEPLSETLNILEQITSSSWKKNINEMIIIE